MIVTEETLIAAAKALHENTFDSQANGLPWEDLEPAQLNSILARTRIVLAAFNPALVAAWNEGREAGWDDYTLEFNVSRNPYE